MSEIIIKIPDSGWCNAECNLIPTDKMLCVILHAYGGQIPKIMQYRKADWLYRESDYFLDISEKWELDSVECGEYWEPSFAPMSIVKSWKPLGLLEEDNKRLVDEIETWFTE